MRKAVISLVGIVSCILVFQVCGQDSSHKDERIETLIIEPVQIEMFYGWVLADKVGPTINWSCQLVGQTYTNSLVSEVDHRKQETCPEIVAAGLAEFAALSYEEDLPLTIFNGWQWEYTYDLSQFKAASFTLDRRGGMWESAWEAIVRFTHATQNGYWEKLDRKPISSSEGGTEALCQSSIDIRTFQSTRIRNGYPKQGKLSQQSF